MKRGGKGGRPILTSYQGLELARHSKGGKPKIAGGMLICRHLCPRVVAGKRREVARKGSRTTARGQRGAPRGVGDPTITEACKEDPQNGTSMRGNDTPTIRENVKQQVDRKEAQLHEPENATATRLKHLTCS